MIGPASLGPPQRPVSTPPPAEAGRAPKPAQRQAEPPPLTEGQFVPMPSTVTFGEFLKALNPLHHIPGVSWVYRQITGETIQPVFRVLGGLLTGGPIGAIVSAIGALIEEIVGRREVAAAPPAPTPPAPTPTAPAPTAPAPPVAAAPASLPAATQREARPSLAERTTVSGAPLVPLPLAAARARGAYASTPREAAPPPAPEPGFVPAAAAMALPARSGDRDDGSAAPHSAASTPAPSAPAPSASVRPRRAPIVPITSGGQDPAFVQRMMQGLEAYERAMRARTAPAPVP
jgi:hypothetical protein